MKTTIDLWHKVWPDPGAFVRASAQDLERLVELVRADEREACAKVCERIGNPSNFDYVGVGGVACAEAIRARGNT
jgi:hypothetical protein